MILFNNKSILFMTNEKKDQMKVFISRVQHQKQHFMGFSFFIFPYK
jgi:hypothetical protein